jgi:hypothetical protein
MEEAIYLTFIVILALLLIITIWIIRNFIKYYVDPFEYESVRFDQLELKSGDLLFIRRFSSPHVFLSGEEFSHIAIVVILNCIPFVLELSYPGIYFMPLARHILGTGQAQTLYIRKIKSQIEITEKQVSNLLSQANKFKYIDGIGKYYFNLINKTNTDILVNFEKEKLGICGSFTMWALNELAILKCDEFNKKIGPNLISWLANHTNFEPLKRIDFISGTTYLRGSDYFELVQETIGLKQASTLSDKTN